MRNKIATADDKKLLSEALKISNKRKEIIEKEIKKALINNDNISGTLKELWNSDFLEDAEVAFAIYQFCSTKEESKMKDRFMSGIFRHREE